MKKFFISLAVIISVVTVLVVGGVYYVLSRGDYDHHIVERIIDKMDDELDLSGDQERRIAEVLNDAVQRFRGSRGESVAALIKQPTLTAEQVREAMNARRGGGTREDREALIADTVVRVHALLTPEQREELAEEIDDMRDEFGYGYRHRHRHRDRWWHW